MGETKGRGGKRFVFLTRRHLVGPATQHCCGDASHNRLRLYMEVVLELVGAPAADHPNAVLAKAGAEECHCATRSCRACGHVFGGVTRVWVDGKSCVDATSGIHRLNAAEGVCPGSFERRRRYGGDGAQVGNPIDKAEDGAQAQMA